MNINRTNSEERVQHPRDVFRLLNHVHGISNDTHAVIGEHQRRSRHVTPAVEAAARIAVELLRPLTADCREQQQLVQHRRADERADVVEQSDGQLIPAMCRSWSVSEGGRAGRGGVGRR